MSDPYLFAFGFGNLAMLGWLAAAAAPLLIHLWSRHRFREAPWAAMQFLLAAMQKNARRLQLQQWLLLALRTLIIALVVLAVAEPYGERLVAGRGSAPVHRALVIDGSFSMAYRDGGASNFARAKQLAAALVRDSRPADTFTVIVMAAPAKTILGSEVVDHDVIASKIEALTQPHTGADLAGAVALVQEALAHDAIQRSDARRPEVYFFTDLQRLTWNPGSHAPWQPGSHALRGNPRPSRSRGASAVPTTQSVADLRSHAERGNEGQLERGNEGLLRDHITALAKLAPLTLIDLGQPQAANLAVTSLNVAEPFVTVGREVAFEVALHQFGQAPRPECRVELTVDGVPIGEQTVDVPAGGDVVARFTHRFLSAGDHTVAVRAMGDHLDIDNARWLIVPVQEEVRVLCVAGRNAAAKFVARALKPNPAGDSPIRPVVVSESEMAELRFADFDCIFLCNVGQLTPGEAERLTRYAAAGGGIVFFLGDRVDPNSYNQWAPPATGSQARPGTGSHAPAPGSHALRGNPLLSRSAAHADGSARRIAATQSVEHLRSHAERGNEKYETPHSHTRLQG